MNSIDRKMARCQSEIDASRKPSMKDACAAFLVNTSVKLPDGTSTFISEADCRQIKGAVQAPMPKHTAAAHAPAKDASPVAAPPSVQKFRVGDRVRPVEKRRWAGTHSESIVTEVRAGEVWAIFSCESPSWLPPSEVELIEPATSPASETETEGWLDMHDDMPDLKAGKYEYRMRGGDLSPARPSCLSIHQLFHPSEYGEYQYRAVKP